jgi:hypothetical protein
MIDLGPNLYNFFVRNLLIFEIRLSVCPSQGFPAYSNTSLAKKNCKLQPKNF